MSRSSSAGTWSTIREQRCGLAEDFRSCTSDRLDRPSWCDGWRVRDVRGHLVHNAEATFPSVLRDLAFHGLWSNTVVRRMARDFGDEPIPPLCDRLREAADGRYHFPGTPPELMLGELLVHRADAFGPLDSSNRVIREDAAAVLPSYWRFARVAFDSKGLRHVALISSDTNWRAGKGPEVIGSAADLMLLLANRRQIVDRLTGPGVSGLVATAKVVAHKAYES